MLSSDSSCVSGMKSFQRCLPLCTMGMQEICFQGLDENMVLLYVTLKYFNSDRDTDTLLARNKNAIDLNLIYSLLSI